VSAPQTFSELRLFAHVDVHGYTQSEVDALRMLAEAGCPRAFAAELMYRSRQGGQWPFFVLARSAILKAKRDGWPQ
jgi:hypothetical protein